MPDQFSNPLFELWEFCDVCPVPVEFCVAETVSPVTLSVLPEPETLRLRVVDGVSCTALFNALEP